MAVTAKPNATQTFSYPEEPPDDGHGEPQASFRERYEAALADTRLSRNLTKFQQDWRVTRTAAVDEIDFAATRHSLKAAKTDVVTNLDTYLDQFRQAAERAGARVHFARDGQEANRIIRDIARLHEVNLIAKSKSMVSEEIELNHDFKRHGIDVVETDLGEWIVQIMHQRPSHIVLPIIHLGRQQIGEVLTEHMGFEVSKEDVGEQVRVARGEIRKAFFAAGMGITGANALIAETGTVMMSTNEGNGRLTSSLPRVHVVLAGIEKLVPTFEDAMTQLRLLGRSATAQRLTSYSTFITGPTPGHEMHIVLVDNGRRRMAELPEFSEALHCIRCAACANVCPPYREVGGHVFGYIYTGAIGLVVTPFLHGVDAVAGPQSLCVSCNACEVVCPVEIPLPRQILDVRKMVVKKKGLNPVKKVVFDTLSRPAAFDLAMRIAARASKPLTRGRFVRGRHVPILKSQTRWRSLPAVPRRPLRDRVAVGVTLPARRPVVPNAAAGKTVALFPGCITDRAYPEQGEAILESLRYLGVNIVFPQGLNCCGLPANNSGDEPNSMRMAKHTIRALERVKADYIVSGSASCVAMIAQDYLHLFRNDAHWYARAERLAVKMMDFTTFLDRVAKLPEGSLVSDKRSGLVPDGAVTYHDSCQGLNALNLHSEPRRLLRDVMGFDLRELPENTLCCGFGGSFSFEYPEVAERLMNRKLNNAESTGATIIVTDNQGCIMHLAGGADAGNRPLRVVHLAQLVAERLRDESTGGTMN